MYSKNIKSKKIDYVWLNKIKDQKVSKFKEISQKVKPEGVYF